MGWEDKARENLYLRDALRATDERDLERRMQNTDKTIDFFKDFGNAIGDVISDAINGKPAPPPPPSGGNIAGKVIAGAAIAAGGAFLLSKLFGSSKDKDNTSNKTIDQTSKSAQEYISLGIKYKESREYTKAIENFDKAVEVNKGNKENLKVICSSLGDIYYEMSDYKMSVEYYNRLLKLIPDCKPIIKKRDEAMRRI